MLTTSSRIPSYKDKGSKEPLDSEILRAGMAAELDAINLYEQLAAATDNADVKKVLSDIAKEEKTHFAEFQTMLLSLDREQVNELEKGRKEVHELIGK